MSEWWEGRRLRISCYQIHPPFKYTIFRVNSGYDPFFLDGNGVREFSKKKYKILKGDSFIGRDGSKVLNIGEKDCWEGVDEAKERIGGGRGWEKSCFFYLYNEKIEL